MNRQKEQAGIGKFTVLVFGLIIVVVGYCAFSIMPFYYYYYELENQMEAAIKVASIETDEEIRKKIWEHIKRMEIPVDSRDQIKITREGNFMRIQVSYSEMFYVTWKGKDYDLREFKFHAQAEGQF